MDTLVCSAQCTHKAEGNSRHTNRQLPNRKALRALQRDKGKGKRAQQQWLLAHAVQVPLSRQSDENVQFLDLDVQGVIELAEEHLKVAGNTPAPAQRQ